MYIPFFDQQDVKTVALYLGIDRFYLLPVFNKMYRQARTLIVILAIGLIQNELFRCYPDP